MTNENSNEFGVEKSVIIHPLLALLNATRSSFTPSLSWLQGLQQYRAQDLREKVPLAESKWHRENKGKDTVEFSGRGS